MATYTGITAECAVPKDITNYVHVSKQPPVSAQVVIGTPGTLRKWMSNRKLNVSNIKILVFDEADHMLAEVNFTMLIMFTFDEIQKNVIISSELILLILCLLNTNCCMF